MSNQLYKIESDVPLPSQTKKLAGDFPFAEMKVGESFHLNGATPQTVGYLAAVFARRCDGPRRKFVVRKTEDGHRCWRIK